ncbi:MAG TPA: hypothetical protein VMY59_05150 [Candidatus Thermoplasmatota archaeon]|nr:hypothetical protein [Candidatus Thermoplasmatota archaeon]
MKSEKFTIYVYQGGRKNVPIVAMFKHDKKTGKMISNSKKHYTILGLLSDLPKDIIKQSDYAKEKLSKAFLPSEIKFFFESS